MPAQALGQNVTRSVMARYAGCKHGAGGRGRALCGHIVRAALTLLGLDTGWRAPGGTRCLEEWAVSKCSPDGSGRKGKHRHIYKARIYSSGLFWSFTLCSERLPISFVIFKVTGFCDTMMNLRLAFLKENWGVWEVCNFYYSNSWPTPVRYLNLDSFPVFSVTSGTTENANRNNFWTPDQAITWQFILWSYARSVMLNTCQHIPEVLLMMPLRKSYSFIKLVLKSQQRNVCSGHFRIDVSGSRRSHVLQCAWLVQRSRSSLGSFLLNKECKGFLDFIYSTGIVRQKHALGGRIAVIWCP